MPPAGSGQRSAGDVVLRVEDLVKTFPVTKGALLKRRVGTLHAVNRVSFELRAGETLGLVDESGSGKTTTLREVPRLRAPEGGRIEVAGTDVATLRSAAQVRELRREVQIVLQDPTDAVDPRMTVFDLLAEPLRASGADRTAVRSRVTRLLDLVGLDRAMGDRFPAALSGGQRQRYTMLGDDPVEKATAGAFTAMLKAVGVKVDINKVSENDFSKVLSDRRFDLFISGNRSTDPFGARYLCDFYCSDRDSNITGSGTPELDQEIRATGEIADLGQQIAAVNKVEQKALQQYAFLPLYSGPSTYGIRKGLANVGATIFYSPLPETIGWQK